MGRKQAGRRTQDPRLGRVEVDALHALHVESCQRHWLGAQRHLEGRTSERAKSWRCTWRAVSVKAILSAIITTQTLPPNGLRADIGGELDQGGRGKTASCWVAPSGFPLLSSLAASFWPDARDTAGPSGGKRHATCLYIQPHLGRQSQPEPSREAVSVAAAGDSRAARATAG